jgi:aminopeptidase N
MKKHLITSLIISAILFFAVNESEACKACESYRNAIGASNVMYHPDYQYTDLLKIVDMPEMKHSCELMRESNIKHRNYDVLRYDLSFDLTDIFSGPADTLINPNWYGSTDITLRIDSANVDEIEIDSRMFDHEVFIDDAEVPFTHDDGLLKIDISENGYTQGDTMTITINYRGNARNTGMYIYPKGTEAKYYNFSTYTEAKLVYTQTETNEGPYWYPCNDYPYDKAFFTTTTKVPEGITVSSNGELVSEDSDGEGNKTFRFEALKYPMAHYLVVLNASEFRKHEEVFQMSEKAVPFTYYAWENDFIVPEGHRHDVMTAFKDDSLMMATLENYYGPYPFDSYGITAVEPYGFGGMEHQTMTTVRRNWLIPGTHPEGIIHEMGHQWLGDLITCATWRDIWINEGGASWSESIWQLETKGETAFNSYQMQFRNYYMYYAMNGNMFDIPLYLPEGFFFPNYYGLSYCKASWIYHMLYKWSDGEFIPALKALLEKHAYTSIETEDFKNTLQEMNFEFPIDLDTFFNQWVYQAGHPIYETSGWGSLNNETNKYEVSITLEQAQSGNNVPEVFDVMNKIIFYDESDDELYQEFVFKNNTQRLDTTFILDFLPTNYYLDLSYNLFSTTDGEYVFEINIPAAVEESTTQSILNISPNPVPVSETFKIELDTTPASEVQIELISYTGETVFSESVRGSSFEIPTIGLSTGLYLVKASFDGKVAVEKVIVK